MFKPPDELFDENVANAIDQIKALDFDEDISTEEMMIQLEEISAVSNIISSNCNGLYLV